MKRAFLKTVIVLFFASCVLLCSAFKWGNIGEKGALLFFSSQPIQKENITNVGRTFAVGEKIYYFLYNPKGFKDDYIRVQIVKKNDKTRHWGYSIFWSKDYHINSLDKEFSSYFVINEPGYYFVQIFSFDDFDRVVARNDFWVR